MHRAQLIHLVNQFKTSWPDELQFKKNTLEFIQTNPDCFERSLLSGHITGSAWIMNRELTHTLLIHHFKLDKWFQPGGHCDGNANVLQVSIQEALEETGQLAVAYSDQIFDIDNHIIPARNEVPQHMHYDIRFLLLTEMTGNDLPTNRETKAIKWVLLNDVVKYSDDRSLARMVEKTIQRSFPPVFQKHP